MLKEFKILIMNDLTLIIPAKNEKDSLPQVIDSLKNLKCKIKVSLKIDDYETINSIQGRSESYEKVHWCAYWKGLYGACGKFDEPV